MEHEQANVDDIQSTLAQVRWSIHNALVDWGHNVSLSARSDEHLAHVQDVLVSLPDEALQFVRERVGEQLRLVNRIKQVLEVVASSPSTRMLSTVRQWVDVMEQGTFEVGPDKVMNLLEECRRISEFDRSADAESAIQDTIVLVLRVAVSVSKKLMADPADRMADGAADVASTRTGSPSARAEPAERPHPESRANPMSSAPASSGAPVSDSIGTPVSSPNRRITHKRPAEDLQSGTIASTSLSFEDFLMKSREVRVDCALLLGRPARILDVQRKHLHNKVCRLNKHEPQAGRWVVELVDGHIEFVKIEHLSCSLETDCLFWQMKASSQGSTSSASRSVAAVLSSSSSAEELGRSRPFKLPKPSCQKDLKKPARNGPAGKVVAEEPSVIEEDEEVEHGAHGGSSMAEMPDDAEVLRYDPRAASWEPLGQAGPPQHREMPVVAAASGDDFATCGPQIFPQARATIVRAPGHTASVGHPAGRSVADDFSDAACRSERQPWTDEDVQRLLDGHRRYGPAWENIRMNCNLRHRTGTQLKDKYRNLVKYGQVAA